MSRVVFGAMALALLATAVPAMAEDRSSGERLAGAGSFEFQMGPYRPMIDAGPFTTLPPGELPPWESSFGNSRRWLFKLHGGKALVRGYGTLELGGGVGYMRANGHGRFADGTVSQERTTFTLVPLALDLTYRLDLVWERLGVPLVPYGRLSLLRDQWWVTGSGGKSSMSGATNGWGWSGGLGLVLDFIDPILTRELDRDTGIKHTMLTFEVQQATVNDFGAKKNGVATSWDLSNDGLMMSFGLLFAF